MEHVQSICSNLICVQCAPATVIVLPLPSWMKGGTTFVTENTGRVGGFLYLKITYSNPPDFEFDTLMRELGVLQFVANAKLGAKTMKNSANRKLKRDMLEIPLRSEVNCGD